MEKDLQIYQKLTAKQKLFVESYLSNPNATAAAKAAGYSEKTARSQGQRLLTNVDIAKMLGERVENAIITADEILTGVKAIAQNGKRDADKLKAYELLGKHLAMWTDKTQLSGEVTTNVRTFSEAAKKIYEP